MIQVDFIQDCIDKKRCTCPQECDCQNPPPDNGDGKMEGIYHISNLCPVHNWNPIPDDECPVHGE